MTIPTKIGVVWSVAFAPDDRTLAIGCGSSVAKSGHVLLLRAAPNSETDAPARLLSLLSNNALAYARGGRWTEAKEHFSRMLELNSTNYIYYHWLAPVLVARGDLNDYRHYSRKIQNLFAETRNPTVAERMAKACLILPNPELNFGVIDKLAATAATANSNDLVWRYGQFVGALAALRQRNYSLALQRIEPVLHRTDNEANLDVCARMVLAMSYQGESQRSEARAALSDGLSLAHAKLPTQESGSLGSYWNDWVISQALLKEAKSLIEGTGSAMEIPKGQR